MKNSGFIVLWFMLCSGCALFRHTGEIKANGVSVQGVPDAGHPATLATSNAGTSVALGEGSIVTVTKIDAIAAKPATKDAPEVKPEPAKEITVIVPKGPTEYRKTENTVSANTGTVDTSIREHQIDAEEKRPLLYAAIASALAAGFFVYRAYPTPAVCCGGASVVFFLAWRMELPPWIAGLALAAIVGGIFLFIGHEKGLYTPVPLDSTAPKPKTE